MRFTHERNPLSFMGETSNRQWVEIVIMRDDITNSMLPLGYHLLYYPLAIQTAVADKLLKSVYLSIFYIL